MVAYQRRLAFSFLLIALALLMLASDAAGVGTNTIGPGFTPTAYMHLPVMVNGAAPTPTAIPPDDLEIEQFVAYRLNELRSAEGLPGLTLVSELTQAARKHARDMADANFTGHTGSDGSNGGERMREAGYYWNRWAEIIGWGFGGNSERMIEWWMNSDIHRSMILSSTFEDFGVGYARNANSDWGHYWTVNFGKRDTLAVSSLDNLSRCTGIAQGHSGGSSVIFFTLEPCQ